MDYKTINNLIGKYFEGETSLEEEKVLRTYFNGPNVEDSLLPYQSVFQFWEEQQAIQLEENFDAELLRLLEIQPTRKNILRPLNTWVIRIAAAIVLALGVWWLVPDQVTPPIETAGIDWSKYEPETPEEAMKVLRTALLKTSNELQQGASVAAGEVTKISKLGKYIK